MSQVFGGKNNKIKGDLKTIIIKAQALNQKI